MDHWKICWKDVIVRLGTPKWSGAYVVTCACSSAIQAMTAAVPRLPALLRVTARLPSTSSQRHGGHEMLHPAFLVVNCSDNGHIRTGNDHERC
jgi:hypothetical protein